MSTALSELLFKKKKTPNLKGPKGIRDDEPKI